MAIKEKIDDIDEDNIIGYMFKLADQLKKGYVRMPHNEEVSLNFRTSEYIDENKNIDNTDAKVTALRRKVGGLYAITIMLVNDSCECVSGDIGEHCILQPEIKVSTGNNKFIFKEYAINLNMDFYDDEEQSLELQYRNKKIYATGLGTSARWDIDKNGKGYVCNDYFPEVEVPSMDFDLDESFGVDQTVLSMKYLSDLNDLSQKEKVEKLSKLIEAYGSWIENKENEIDTLPKEYHEIAHKNIYKCQYSYKRMKSGIERLKSDSIAWDAFQLTNRAMYMQRIHIVLQNKTSNIDRFPGDKQLTELLEQVTEDYSNADSIDLLKDDKYSWRPFQLAFLLMSVVSITDDESSDRDLVDLIWFPTGGGKTEAYLGLTAFTIFYRRMKCPDKSGGTSVIMRYTLRLLAAQQFTRASTLICACEYIRQDCNNRRSIYRSYNLGNEPITIGLWIGHEHTPNTNKDAKYNLENLMKASAKNLRFAKERYNKFQVLKCPWCGTKLIKEENSGILKGSYGYRIKNKKYFEMFCTNEDCTFNKCDYLPIQIVDDELYKNPPSLLFGTVDKFAMMPWKDSIGSYFGIENDNRPPELVIQDELHLISGPLGTIVGLYETAIDELCKSKGRKPKIVASTATIRRAKEQCSALYDRNVAQFPSPGLDAEDSFFARESILDHDSNKYGRIYVGLMPSGKTKAMMEIRSIAALMQTINMMELDSDLKDKLWTLTVYFNSLKELGKCSTLINDNVKSFIRIIARRLNASNVRKIYGIDELTSRVTTTELNETLDKLENQTYCNDKDINKKVSSILIATNMISVGIDVARLNTMLMVGQPKLTSEYIQASSRVGRNSPGVVFVMYDGARSRDRSHYEQFKSYHESFYKYVEPTGATPFSKPARDRALHAVVITLMRYLNHDLIEDKNASNFSIEKYEECINYIKKVIVQRSKSISQRLGLNVSNDSDEIEREIERIFEKWEMLSNKYETFYYGYKFMVNNPQDSEGRLMKSFNTDVNDNESFETMTSMRNVDSMVAGNVLIWEE